MKAPIFQFAENVRSVVCGRLKMDASVIGSAHATCTSGMHLIKYGKHGTLDDILIRLGAYGEPIAVPLSTWYPFLRMSAGHTGYSHAWRYCNQRWRRYIMASVHSVSEAHEAHSAGWRTFRTRTAHEPTSPFEILCPASSEGGARTTCAKCGACNGNNGQSVTRKSVVISAHGTKPTLASYNYVLRS